jgi:hypothetical protein
MSPVYANAIVVGRCGRKDCTRVHIDFLDEDNDVVACAAIPLEEVEGFIKNITSCAYEIITETNK